MKTRPRPKLPSTADLAVFTYRKVKPAPWEASRFIQEAAISHNATSVLVAIAAHASNQTGWCYQSIQTLCDFSKLGKTTVWETIHQCVADGYLHVEAPAPRHPLNYIILWHQLPYRKKARRQRVVASGPP